MPSVQAPNILSRAWYRWKAVRLPWRKQWLVGADLSGNTFWEFVDQLNANRLRRIVKYGRQEHYADIKISPQWHQWLRHTRDEAPTLQEQQFDLDRQAMMKRLAAQADERWNAKPSFLDAPSNQQPQPAIGVKDPGGYVQQTQPEEKAGVGSAVDGPEQITKAAEGKPEDEGRSRGGAKEKPREPKTTNPWEGRRPKGAPSENWQPEAWTPGAAQRR